MGATPCTSKDLLQQGAARNKHLSDCHLCWHARHHSLRCEPLLGFPLVSNMVVGVPGNAICHKAAPSKLPSPKRKIACAFSALTKYLQGGQLHARRQASPRQAAVRAAVQRRHPAMAGGPARGWDGEQQQLAECCYFQTKYMKRLSASAAPARL
jgi:hypothetical protein